MVSVEIYCEVATVEWIKGIVLANRSKAPPFGALGLNGWRRLRVVRKIQCAWKVVFRRRSGGVEEGVVIVDLIGS